jgi:hypothetical protein
MLHIHSGKIVDMIIKFALKKRSLDNLSVIFIPFRNIKKFVVSILPKNSINVDIKSKWNPYYLKIVEILNNLENSEIKMKEDDESEKIFPDFFNYLDKKLFDLYSYSPKKHPNVKNSQSNENMSKKFRTNLPSFKINY